MKYKSAKHGWYKVLNSHKFIKPLDEYMQSCKWKDNSPWIQYKSRLERIAFCYADLNPKILKFSIEPFAIQYFKPLDGKMHRYYIDMYVEFVTGQKFLVEVKSFAETQYPRKPSVATPKAILRYKDQLETYSTNASKWATAKLFAQQRGMQFIILTENELIQKK